jgi:hypothetical protein
MTKDYITEYSWPSWKFQPDCAKTFGGSNNESLGKDSKMWVYAWSGVEGQAADYVKGMPTYWETNLLLRHGLYWDCSLLLGIIALFIDERKKYFFQELLLLWYFPGEKFPALTDFFIDYVPMYNKFRAVSSIQVILELCFPF